MTAQRPIHQIRFGRIVAAIWLNQTNDGSDRHNVTLSRIYKPEAGDWQRTTSLGRNDLPLAMKVLDQAHSWIYAQAQQSSDASA